jgi:hypothetical protein
MILFPTVEIFQKLEKPAECFVEASGFEAGRKRPLYLMNLHHEISRLCLP